MTIRTINTGTSANSGDGDTLRVAFTKINNNFQEIATLIGSSSTDFTEIAQDAVSNLFIHDNHIGITAEYNDAQNIVELSVETYDQSLNTFDAVQFNGVVSTGTIFQGTAYDGIEYSDTSIRVDANTNSFAQMIMKNHNAGSNASTDLVIMNNNGDNFNNLIDLGINSSNYENIQYGVTKPNDGYLFVNGGDLVIGTQSPDTKIVFHAGGTAINESTAFFDQYEWVFNRRVTIDVDSPSPLKFTAINRSSNVVAQSLFEVVNNLGTTAHFGINSSHPDAFYGQIGPNEAFLHVHGSTATMHLGSSGDLKFYSDEINGYSGTPTLVMSRIDQSSTFAGHILPNADQTYDLGSSSTQWRSLYVGTSTVYFGGIPLRVTAEGGITVNDVPVGGIPSQLANGEALITLDNEGSLVFGNGGLIRETVVTDNPTIVIEPADADSPHQALYIKGGAPGYSTFENDIGVNTEFNQYNIGATVSINVFSIVNASSTLYWWLDGVDQVTPTSGTVIINEFGGSDFPIQVEVLTAEPFRIYIGPTDGITATAGVTVSINGEFVPDYHLHLTTGDLTDTSIIVGTDDHNIRTTVDGGVEINTILYSAGGGGGSGKWTFNSYGDLTFPGSSNARIGEDEPGLVVFSDAGFAVVTNAGSVNTYEVEFIGYVSNGFGDSPGATLTVLGITAGTITDGMTIYGAGLPPEGWAVTFGGGVMEPQGSGGTGNYLLDGANILTSSQSFNNNVLAEGSHAWIFGNNGNLTLPTGGDILDSNGDSVLGGGGGIATGVSISDDNLILELKDPNNNGPVIRSLVLNSSDFEVASTELGSSNGFVINTNVTDVRRQWQFGNNGGLTFPDTTVQTTAYVAADNVTKVTGTWTVTTGTNNYSFTVPINGVYQLWVRGNIPNGIVSYTATAAVTNSNVPVLGTQYAWNYTGAGDPILFTTLPTQFIGTEGTISTSNPSVGTATNTFVFGIANSTAENITVEYGYTKIS